MWTMGIWWRKHRSSGRSMLTVKDMKIYNYFLTISASMILAIGVFVLVCDEKLLAISQNAIGILLGISATGIYIISCLNNARKISREKLSPKKIVFLYIALWITFIGLIAFIVELFLLGFSIRENHSAYIGIISEISILCGIIILLKQNKIKENN
jgi:hypothetical protein